LDENIVKIKTFNLQGVLIEELDYIGNKSFILKSKYLNNTVYIVELVDSNNRVIKTYKIIK
tara:strand:+ start:530 stop:712 length:183 start_codon:yes stop_codon:yes gene_type:complete